MKDVKEKFRNIDIWSFDGKGDINNILKFQSIFNITLPNTYRELMTRYNNPKFEQDTFDFYDPYHERESLASFGFDGFNSQYENIYNQFIYSDEDDMKMCIHLLIHLKETGYALIIEILLQHQNQRSL